MSGFERFSIVTGSGDDIVQTGSLSDTVTSAAGADSIAAGAGADSIAGGDGNDTLHGGAGADTMSGGLGSDVYVVDSTADIVSEAGGNGTDEVRSSVSWTLEEGQNLERLVLLGTARVGRGSELDNVAIGNAVDNFLFGGLGSDLLSGLGGQDWMVGGEGGDTLEGGDGRDTLGGEAGGDALLGGNGADRLLGGAGNDTLLDDQPTGPIFSADQLFGGDGDDRLETYGGSDIVLGGEGIDLAVINRATATVALSFTLLAPTATSTLAGDGTLLSGVERVDVTLGFAADRAALGGLEDRAAGGAGADTLSGGAGDDTLNGGLGADLLNGGIGTDLADYGTASAAVKVFLVAPALNAGEAAGDTLLSIEDVAGSGFDDELRGSAVANRLSGGEGNDTLLGGAGADTLSGGLGGDRFVYVLPGDSGPTARDLIIDFVSGTDLVDLRQIDANTLTAGNQAFIWAGSGGFIGGGIGSARFAAAPGGLDLLLDTNGDAAADAAIRLLGIGGLLSTDVLL